MHGMPVHRSVAAIPVAPQSPDGRLLHRHQCWQATRIDGDAVWVLVLITRDSRIVGGRTPQPGGRLPEEGSHVKPGKRTYLTLIVAVVIALAVPTGAVAVPPDDTPDRPHSQNMHLIGSSLRAGAVTGPPPVGPGDVPWDTRNTDLAFWTP